MELLLEEVDLADPLADRPSQRVVDLIPDVLEQPVGLLDEGDPSEDDLRLDNRLPGLLGDRRDDDEDPVVGEHPPVP